MPDLFLVRLLIPCYLSPENLLLPVVHRFCASSENSNTPPDASSSQSRQTQLTGLLAAWLTELTAATVYSS